MRHSEFGFPCCHLSCSALAGRGESSEKPAEPIWRRPYDDGRIGRLITWLLLLLATAIVTLIGAAAFLFFAGVYFYEGYYGEGELVV